MTAGPVNSAVLKDGWKDGDDRSKSDWMLRHASVHQALAAQANRFPGAPQPNSINNSQLAQAPALTLKGNNTGATANVADLTVAQVLAMLAPVYYVASSLTLVAGTYNSGNLASTQTMLDGNVYSIQDTNATPGFNIQFGFSGITRTPTEIITRCLYNGANTNDIEIELYNYNTATYDMVDNITVETNYSVNVVIVPDWTNYVSAGAAQLAFYHVGAGSPPHNMLIDYVALRASI